MEACLGRLEAVEDLRPQRETHLGSGHFNLGNYSKRAVRKLAFVVSWRSVYDQRDKRHR